MKTLLLSIIIIFIVTSLSAQNFDKSVGIRLGYTNGIFFDKQNEDLSTSRFMMSWRDNGQQFSVLKINRHYKASKLPENFSFYYGLGMHGGFVRWNEQTYREGFGSFMQRKTAPIIGFDVIFGFSYDYTKLPISLTCDVKPFIDLWGENTFKYVSTDFSIGAVYSF